MSDAVACGTEWKAEPAPTMARPSRFTVDGSEQLEERLADICEQVAQGVRRLIPASLLEGLLLGGGYGRGEGGVLRTECGDEPYNDMEFYVMLREPSPIVSIGVHSWFRLLNERRFRDTIHALAESLSTTAGIEIELKLLSFARLQRAPASMFYYDLIMGHRWLIGHEDQLAGAAQHRNAAALPLHEATRLLMNRCSGLLFGKEKLERADWTPADADFVRRNIAKAQLALGDAVLTAFGQYHWSCRERSRRLLEGAFAVSHSGPSARVPNLDGLRKHHLEGVEFKLNPIRSCEERALLRARHEQITKDAGAVFLWLENRRLRTNFSNLQEYGLSRHEKCPETNRFRNVLVSANALGSRVLRSNATRHPRERVLSSLALLLWNPGLSDPGPAEHVRSLLGTDASSFTEVVEAYRRLWSKVA